MTTFKTKICSCGAEYTPTGGHQRQCPACALVVYKAERASYNTARRGYNAADAAYRATHKDEIAAYRASHKEEIKAYREAHKEERRTDAAGDARRNRAGKLAAFNAYGGQRCACCGETLFEGLTIDHVNGDGAKHKTESGRKLRGGTLYGWLKKNGYPPGFQVLCGTCNLAKGTKGYCPHKDTTPTVTPDANNDTSPGGQK